MYTNQVNYDCNVGGTCKHAVNSEATFTFKGWHVISILLQTEEVKFKKIFTSSVHMIQIFNHLIFAYPHDKSPKDETLPHTHIIIETEVSYSFICAWKLKRWACSYIF
jgi:hypothetical protein